MDVHGVVERGRVMGLREGRTSTTLVSGGGEKRAWGMTRISALEIGDVVAGKGKVVGWGSQVGGEWSIWTGQDWDETRVPSETEFYAFAMENRPGWTLLERTQQAQERQNNEAKTVEATD